MSKGFRLLRVEYIFSVLVPCLLCIYFNNFNPINHIWILAGFSFYAITGNTLNDAIDMNNPTEKETLERVKGYQRKEILVLSIASFVLGTMCFWNVFIDNPLILIYLVVIIALVIFYCKFKSLVIINQIILGVSHIFLPWFIIKINAGEIILNFLPALSIFEWLILAAVASVAFTGQMLHELIDGDSLSKLTPKKAQIIIWISCLVSLIIGILSVIITQDLLFLPIIIFPIGILYIFRKPRNNLLGRTSLKDTGIILGNLVLVYVIILVIAP
jgi:hypothetical protein